MEPPARESVRRMNAHIWTLGSQMMCIRVGVEEIPPLNSLCSWQDGDSMFHLLTRDETLLMTSGEGDSAIDRIQECGTGGSVWAIGSEAICKVKGWCEDRQLEAATIAFLRAKCPSVPVPEVLYSWIDHAFQRTFLVMRRVHGRTLNQAWPDLSDSQRLNIANELAQHCSVLALQTSSRYETASGHGVLEYWLMGSPPASNPTWLPMVLGPFTGTQMKSYMSQISTKPVPEFDEQLPFYHPDLGPTNILVSDDGKSLTAIIDWEAAAYFPSFWVATRPATNWAFRLSEPNTDTVKNAWSSLFVKALEGKGFKCSDKVYTEWSSANTGPA
ncbi:hypothetical protein CC80DRAFT_489872 [Byssothecium circinans]|uniref:Aminoglycoside phosphotransferase domain-containing protein n=1 Tax=Byssothecium circinans TaxID=147558 RepID=A0A6A5UAA2_9PLEO|nr:hypothetical protein CC80DRAFT_489872 [Byssothecium circinans]